MRGLLATALLAPTLASALVVPNTWDGVDIASATHTEISHAVRLSIPIAATATHAKAYSSSLRLEIDLAQSGPECGSGDLIINGVPVPYGMTGALELTEYLELRNIQMKWDLTCGPLSRALVFAVTNVNGKTTNDLGVTVLYSQDDTSLEILDVKKFSTMPEPVRVDLPSDKQSYGGLRIEEEQDPKDDYPVPNGAQAPIAEKPAKGAVSEIQGIALCDSVKCVFMVAVHNTKETAKHITSKAKSIFCHGKPRESHPSKCHQSNEDEVRGSDVMLGHDEATPSDCHHDEAKAHHRIHHGHHGHHGHRGHRGHQGKWQHVRNAIHPSLIVFSVLFFAILMFHIRRRIRRAKKAAAHGASGCADDCSRKRRRRCCGWRRRRCRERRREYSEKDEVLPRTEPNPAYSTPSHIATEIADLRHAAEAVEDIVSQSSEGSRYARRGSADTMETLPEYTAEDSGPKMGTETLPGYADSEESVSVADGYQPGTGEVWRARVDGVNVKE
ncbi:hypothetical protein O988_01731 [Pseudogymnoascus sp. VKM F-3808]|nr:hypothetical protein O988_01731 [Pseudogymnoascus sp. VKM F-3808]